MGTILDLADRYFEGHVPASEHHPFAPLMALEQVAPGTAFVSSFANVTAVATDAGLVLFDTGSHLLAAHVYALVREWSDRAAHTIVFTHGHIDHVSGVERYEADAADRRAPAPRVVAHANVPARFDRYQLTRGYNSCINSRQFRAPVEFPSAFRYPDATYESALALEVGGERVELHHALGETDDATWAYLPARRLLVTGDLFIWAAPNAGNPQKVQRYPREWARALRAMDACGAEVLLPGHGLPIVGAARVRRALTETAALLESLVEQTLALMNAGARLDEVLHTVAAPPALLERPYLRPVYDEPEFIVRNIWRLYGGWYDGNPARLKPAPDAALARELAQMAGGARALADRAQALADAGELRLAAHFAEWAAQAAPRDPGVWKVRRAVYAERAKDERSLMARGIFESAAGEAPPPARPRGKRAR